MPTALPIPQTQGEVWMRNARVERDSGLNQPKSKYLIFAHFITCITWRHSAKAPHRALEGDCANDRVGA